eukprot:gene716-946_t
MGMGEPLNNYENVKRAVEFMIDNKRFGLSPKHITVSTVGVLKNMYRLTAELPYVNLAFSLHAPNQEVRIKIVPAAAAHRLDRLMDAVDNHIQFNSRSWKGKARKQVARKISVDETAVSSDVRVEAVDTEISRDSPPEVSPEVVDNDTTTNNENATDSTVPDDSISLPVYSNSGSGVMIEYILIQDVNDLEAHAHELGALLAPRREHILLNLIPYNPTIVAEDFHAP